MHFWAKISHAIFGTKWVVLVDFDGEENFRRVLHDGGNRLARRMGFGVCTVFLFPNGMVKGALYVTKWKPVFPENGDLT